MTALAGLLDGAALTVLRLREVTPYARNPRQNDQAVDAVVESIKRYGYNQPIVLDRDHIIVAGDTRFRALLRLHGPDARAPFLVASHLSDAAVREYRIADNKVADLATWDLEKLRSELRTLDRPDIAPFFGVDELERLLVELPALDSAGHEKVRATSSGRDSFQAGAEKVRTGIQRDQVEVSCPHCAARLWLDRQDLERRPGPAVAPSAPPAPRGPG